MFRCIAKIVNPHFLIRFLLVTLTTLLLTFLGSGEKFAMAGTATLTWTAPTTNVDGTPLTDLAGYKVYFGTTSKIYSSTVNAGLNVGSPPSYVVNNLSTGIYYFAVTAYDTTGLESAYSNESSKSFIGPVISAISASNITISGATINWTTSISANSQVEYGTTTAYGTLTTLDATLVTGHSQILSGLLAGTIYHFRVRSADGSGALSVSGDNTFTTASNPGPVISAVTAGNITASGAAISWTTNVSANSQVESGTTTSYGSSSTLDATLVTGHSQTLSGLQAGTTYHFRVRSADGTGSMSVSGDNTFTTTLNVGPVISAITATNITTSGATINWTTSISANSQVESGTTTAYGSLTTLDATLVTGHSQILSGLLAGTIYHFRVRSADGSGALSVSGDNTFTTTNPPPVISAITATNIGASSVTINWTTNVLANSQVESGTTTAYGSLSTLSATLVTGHSQTLSSLLAGTAYHFRVRSADGTGALSISGDNTFTTTLNTGPVISAITSASISNTGTTITWTTNISSTSQVEYGTTTAYGSSTSLDATLVTGHNLTFGGLRSGTIYHFRVDSADGLGNRSISSDYTFTTTGPTRPAAPALHSQKK